MIRLQPHRGALQSPGHEPWGQGRPPHAQPRQGRQRLLPDIPLVVRDPMRLQEGEEFLLQGNRAVVLLLVANILHHRGYVGLADAEGAVPRLPSEGRPMPPNSSSPHGSRRGLFSIGPPGLRGHLPGPSNVETPGHDFSRAASGPPSCRL